MVKLLLNKSLAKRQKLSLVTKSVFSSSTKPDNLTCGQIAALKLPKVNFLSMKKMLNQLQLQNFQGRKLACLNNSAECQQFQTLLAECKAQ